MTKFLMALCLTLTTGTFAFAQTDDYKKGEFYVGFSNNQVDNGTQDGDDFEDFFNDRSSFNGFNASAVGNVSRYVGIKGDVSGTYRSDDLSGPLPGGTAGQTVSFRAKSSVYNFLGGVQLKDNSSEKRFKPFAHALVGAGHFRTKFDNVTCSTGVGTNVCSGFETTESETGLAGAFGGGIDIRAGNRVDIRVIQVDYNPMRLDGTTLHNFRFGFGVVFK